MLRILVLFETTDGYTRRVAERLGSMFRASFAAVDVVRTGLTDADPQFYDGIVVCASIHARGYRRPVSKWVRANAAVLNARYSALVSISPGVLQKDPGIDRDLDAIAERFFAATGWQPARRKRVAGALLYRQYGFVKRWMTKRIVSKAGGDTDTSRDYEYTDWDDLRTFVEEFTRGTARRRDTALTFTWTPMPGSSEMAIDDV
jgi:menaquinone-dependent protoporphyrinogen oxidase